MTFNEYLIEVAQELATTNRVRRVGQTYFNVLTRCNPGVANQVRGKTYDPFHNDKELTAFLDFVEQAW